MFYENVANELLKGNIDFSSDNFELLLVDTSIYQYDENHIFESEIPDDAIISSAKMTGLTVSDKRFYAHDLSFSDFNIKEDRMCGALVIVKDSGYKETSLLIKFITNNIDFPTEVNTDFSISWPVDGIFEIILNLDNET